MHKLTSQLFLVVADSSTAADYRTGYQFMEDTFPALEDEIRKLHKNVGNAKTEGYEVVVGYGGTGVMNAIMYAITSTGKDNEIFAQPPFYPNYISQAASTMAVVNNR